MAVSGIHEFSKGPPRSFRLEPQRKIPFGGAQKLNNFMWGGGPNVDRYFSLEITYLIPSTPYFIYKRAGEEKGKHFMVFGKGAGLPKQLDKKNSGENTYQTCVNRSEIPTYLDDPLNHYLKRLARNNTFEDLRCKKSKVRWVVSYGLCRNQLT